MLRDLWFLSRFEIKRVRRSSRYWLGQIGFEPNQSRGMQLYVLLFWLFWAYTVWSFLVQQMFQLRSSMRPEDIAQLQPLIPRFILGVQLLFLARVLRDPPLKMPGADLQYLATAPVSRGMIALVQFMVKETTLVFVVSWPPRTPRCFPLLDGISPLSRSSVCGRSSPRSVLPISASHWAGPSRS
ncbi:MAG: hypothetical protein IPK19_14415 [Chloroflexi bacterium]|nr:hypothetical protein [Chloroflexota bacterium]